MCSPDSHEHDRIKTGLATGVDVQKAALHHCDTVHARVYCQCKAKLKKITSQA